MQSAQATSAFSGRATAPDSTLSDNSTTTNFSLSSERPIVSFKHRGVQLKAEIDPMILGLENCKKNHLINEIVQCPNAHLLCRQCLEHEQQTQNLQQLRCPDHHTAVFEDKFNTREIISNYSCRCPSNITRENNVCTWTGPLKRIREHLDECPNLPPKDRVTIMQNARSEDAKIIKKLTNRVAELESMTKEIQEQIPLEGQQRLAELEKRSVANSCLIESLQNEIATLQLSGVNPPDLPATAGTLAVNTDFIGPTPDGSWIWRIDNFLHKSYEAQVCQEKRAIFSPEFNTTSGYKLCTKLYLDGDGNGRGTHVSLCVSVLKGKFDPVLRWPFSHNVTFMILDQLNGSHEIVAFDLNLYRPMGDNNDFTSCYKLLQHSKLNQGYVVDDTMFIKIVIKD